VLQTTTTTTDASDHYESCPPTLCVVEPVITWAYVDTQHRHLTFFATLFVWKLPCDVIFLGKQRNFDQVREFCVSQGTAVTVFTSRRHASAVYTIVMCPSVCLSVTRRCSIKTVKPGITQTTPYDSPGTLVFCRQNVGKIPMGSLPTEAK